MNTTISHLWLIACGWLFLKWKTELRKEKTLQTLLELGELGCWPKRGVGGVVCSDVRRWKKQKELEEGPPLCTLCTPKLASDLVFCTLNT